MTPKQEIKVLFDYMLLTTEHRVAFAIRCVLEVYHEPKFVSWAHDWLSGKDQARAAAGASPRLDLQLLAELTVRDYI